jgi:hypothetical protein
MDPQVPPDPERLGVAPEAFEEIRKFGSDNRYKPAVADVLLFWRKVRKDGLPPGLKHRLLFTLTNGEQAGDWRLYVESISGIRVGISESIDGAALWLLLVNLNKSVSFKEAVAEALRRAK